MPKLKKKSAEQRRRENKIKSRRRRQEDNYRQQEQINNTAAHAFVRSHPATRVSEQERLRIRRTYIRKNPQRRIALQILDSARRTIFRLNKNRRRLEQSRDTRSHQIIRMNLDRRINEQNRNTILRQSKRQNLKRKVFDQSHDSASKKRKRVSLQNCILQLKKKYESEIKEQPSKICSCCGDLQLQRKIVTMKPSDLSKYDELFRKSVVFVSQSPITFCHKCHSYIRKLRVPKLALSNGLSFPEIPNEIRCLSPLEERLVSPRLPFMQIRPLGCDRQSALRGNIVNVENDLDVCAKVLPRSFTECSTVQVKLKRRLCYNSVYMYETIEPYRVYNAAKILCQTELYKKHKIKLSSEWERVRQGESFNFICNGQDGEEECESDTDDVNLNNEEFHEEELANEQTLRGAEETYVFDENNMAFHGIVIAPGANKKPIPLYQDEDAETLSFPKIYCGIPRRINPDLKLSYTEIAKSELMRYDRRACVPSKILYAMRKKMNEQISSALKIALRKTSRENITAQQISSPGFLQQLLNHDEGYTVFKHVRSTPAYWQKQCKKVISMIRQQGKCTFFITLSAAETKWHDLIILLMKLSKQTNITPEEVDLLEMEEIRDLIRNDPVTCVTHFNRRYHAFYKNILKPPGGVFNPHNLTDHFSRLEFQMRGSPHSHGLFWIKDAPFYDAANPASHSAVIQFIDNFITCKRDEYGEMEGLLTYQLHKHTHTCHKKMRGKKQCRFGFPKPPLPTTSILTPLPNDTSPETRAEAESNFLKIQDVLTSFGRSFKDEISFFDFLSTMNMTMNEYTLSIRSSIKRNTVFLKRSVNAAFINNYNREMLLTWRANIDIQYVLDTYACAKYCAGYVLKAEGGVSKLLRAAMQEVKRGNLEIRERLKRYASVLQNGSEISAQEAAAFLLSLPFTDCSRGDVYVNTSLPDERVKMLKSNDEIALLEPTSRDIFTRGILEHYQLRPLIMENTCLAEFATLYEFTKKKRATKREIDVAESMLLDGSGYLYKRNRHKILRFRHYSKNNDEINYWREQLMLFVPWRNEELEFACQINFVSKAVANMPLITSNSKPFYFDRNMDEFQLNEYVHQANCEDDGDNLVNNHWMPEGGEEASGMRYSDTSRVEKFLPPKLIEDEKYFSIMRSLNEGQRRFVLQVLHNIKTSTTPFYYFLTGGAGVGKSHAITAIVQSVLRYENRKRTENPEQLCVVVCAPTGKAAFNVFGMTIHSTFHLLPNQSYERIKNLNESDVSSLRSKLRNLRLIIIDEISMVGSKQLYEINERLKQIFHTKADFGGISILAVGHLRQLPPVNARYVFEDPIHIPLGSLFGNILWRKFQLFELTEIMRQRGQFEFSKALNNMAEGQMDNDDIQLIKSREIPETFVPPHHTIYLFPTNAECKNFNDKIHSKLNTEGVMSTASDKVEGVGSTSQMERLLEEAKGWDHTKADGLPYQTYLKVDGIYFITTNVDVQDGLFNGATGVLKKIDVDNNKQLTHAWIKFENDLIGVNARQKSKMYQLQNRIPLSWVKISFFVKTLTRTGRKGGLKIVRKQIPLLAANAMTVHKSQGSSLESVVVSVENIKGKSARELLYVACSRATSLQGLFILGNFKAPKKPSANDKVSLEMGRLRNNIISSIFPCFSEVRLGSNILFYQNINGIRNKILDLKADPWVTGGSILCFVEPRIHANESIYIQDFKVICRKDSVNRNSEGVIIFSKIDFSSSFPSYIVHRENNSHLCVTNFHFHDINTFLLYKHASFPFNSFLTTLEMILSNEDGPFLILGDINLNLQIDANKPFIDLMNKWNMKSAIDIISPTNDNNSTIDICFTNSLYINAFVYESYFSDHKPIVVSFPKS